MCLEPGPGLISEILIVKLCYRLARIKQTETRMYFTVNCKNMSQVIPIQGEL